ncbi:MAG TPA: hypothetical protein VG860_15035 [Terriglobia bacterium]|jgi:hypothetical protein|nr:hypothetical protein [Terriglobia bacterium]
MTRVSKFLAICFCFALLCSIASPKASADEWDKKTVLTFSGPVQVGKTRLDAGTYVFKLADTYDRHTVQIFNKNENHLIATIFAIPDYRLEPTDGTVVKFAETAADGSDSSGVLPVAGVPIKEWFYPGDNFGQEFKVAPQPVETAALEPPPPAAEAEPAQPAPAPVTEPPAEQSAAAPQPETPPQPQAQPAPAPAQTDQQPAQPAPAPATTLPKTASLVPLLGLVSALSLALAGGLRAFAKRVS